MANYNPDTTPLWQNTIADRSPEEVKAVTSKAGKASGVARRKYKTMRESLKLILSLDVNDEQKAEALRLLGIEPTFQNAIQLSMARRATDGDVEAARFVRDTSGEKPAQAVDVAVSDKPFESLNLKELSDAELSELCGSTVVQDGERDH